MKIQIEDYYGNDLIILKFAMLDSEINDERYTKLSDIAMDHEYSIADIDKDDDGLNYVRIQQIDDAQDEDAQKDLIKLVAHLTSEFIFGG